MTRPAIHPGEILRDELAELGVTPTELSRQIEVPPNRVTEIIHGRRSITGDTALRLGRWFGSSARFWLNLQSAYDLRAAEEQAGRKSKSSRSGSRPKPTPSASPSTSNPARRNATGGSSMPQALAFAPMVRTALLG